MTVRRTGLLALAAVRPRRHVMFAVDYRSGRSVYGALATYHAYLEFPVLLALLLGTTGSRNTVPAFSAHGVVAAGR